MLEVLLLERMNSSIFHHIKPNVIPQFTTNFWEEKEKANVDVVVPYQEMLDKISVTSEKEFYASSKRHTSRKTLEPG